jgi:predicted enzyme related to lactoylglutathione lyase
MKIRAVDFVGYHVSDLKRSVAFYRDILGLQFLADSSDVEKGWAEFQIGNVTFDMLAFDPARAGTSSGLALAVDDVKKALEELRSKGVKVVQEQYETRVCWGAGIADPDGNQIYLHQRKDGTAG